MPQWTNHAHGTVQEITFCDIRIVVLRLKSHLFKVIIDSQNPLISSTTYDIKENSIDVAKSETLYKLQHILRNKTRDIDVLNHIITSAIEDLEPKSHDVF